MKIYDCFTFYNELDLLEIRLNELDCIADYFVLVEAHKTHQNKCKDLFFASSKHEDRFKKFIHKIIHIIVEEDEFNNDSWHNERLQRAKIIDGLKNASDEDVIIISDLDEIPSSEAVKRAVQQNIKHCVFEQILHYAYLNTPLSINGCNISCGSVVVPKNVFISDPDSVRNCSKNSLYRITNGGWHFSFLGNVDHIYNKLQNYAHTEFVNITKEAIENSINNMSDILQRPGHALQLQDDISYLPEFIQCNYKKFNKFILLKHE
jgi:beta-1,4-mannosyl-glycoprotein beta-1,4-N-acetylglucosaminyltransferase